MERIGIYGGTFNPPHLGHIGAAQCAVKALGLSKLLVIPDRIAPHKQLPLDSPSPEQERLEKERMEQERLEKERQEQLRLEQEKAQQKKQELTVALLLLGGLVIALVAVLVLMTTLKKNKRK